MGLKKEDHYVQVYMGASYDIGKPETVGQLKSVLEQIVADLPSDETLKISEIDLRDGKLDYTLVDGITQ